MDAPSSDDISKTLGLDSPARRWKGALRWAALAVVLAAAGAAGWVFFSGTGGNGGPRFVTAPAAFPSPPMQI